MTVKLLKLSHNTLFIVLVNYNTNCLVFIGGFIMQGNKNKVYCAISGAIEWFDFALYGFLCVIFNKLFISPNNYLSGILCAFTIFMVGYAARPIGGLLFGYIGDKYGRRIPLCITPICISVLTASIGLLPTYNTIGNTAILLLTIIRILQGIFIGGESVGNMVYIYESSTKQKYFWGSISSCSGSLGILCASTTFSILFYVFNKSFIYQNGWRIPFLFSIPLGIFALVLRLKLTEPESFRENTKKYKILSSIMKDKLLFFTALGLIYLHATSFYFVFVFIPTFLTNIRHLPETASLLNNAGFLLFHLMLIPIFGLIIEKVGIIKSQIVVSIFFLLFSCPIFYFISYGNNEQIFISLCIFSFMTSINASIIPGLIASIFPINTRYTLFGFTFNISFGIFGGVIPLICFYLIKTWGNLFIPCLCLLIAALISLLSTHTLLNIRKRSEIRKISFAI